MEQGLYDLLFAYLRDKNLPPDLSKNKKDSLRRKAKSFVLKNDGLLYFRDKKRETDLQVRT